MAKGFSQKEGIDYQDTFVPVGRYTYIKPIMSFDSMIKWNLHQMDANIAYLNGVIEEELYIKQP